MSSEGTYSDEYESDNEIDGDSLKETLEKESSYDIKSSQVKIQRTNFARGKHFEVYEGYAFSSVPVIIKKSTNTFTKAEIEKIARENIPRM